MQCSELYLIAFYPPCVTLCIDLEQQLKASDGRVKMIVTDGVFSMDGKFSVEEYVN